MTLRWRTIGLCALNTGNNCLMRIEPQQEALNLDERGKFAEVSYENLCDNPRDELTRLAEFIGVDPDQFGYNLESINSTN